MGVERQHLSESLQWSAEGRGRRMEGGWREEWSAGCCFHAKAMCAFNVHSVHRPQTTEGVSVRLEERGVGL